MGLDYMGSRLERLSVPFNGFSLELLSFLDLFFLINILTTHTVNNCGGIFLLSLRMKYFFV